MRELKDLSIWLTRQERLKNDMKWSSLDKEKPRCAEEIIFSDGKESYFGWLETYAEFEELSFYDCISRNWPEGIIEWMYKPKPSGEKI